jgi:hypothetical protein
MNRLTGAFLIAAVLALAGCGGGGSSGGGGASTSDSVTLATKMINEATSESCPTQDHCIRWPVESLATVSQPDDAKTLDL